ncbi:beta-aspartyl-peptidase [Evansella cellulosilytica]|uniref:Isoaspartyl dipeptidase n=1 Tax=Evansella cellulosilytica (strain ATCC 21833 / DSM 2522 / FERM P-1141 / JCM 9156 / N-4) TaxID=649639 RepID=E6TYQ9_EVAC2|nr:beta-aspartyl-peptidase [Evansella cellulosilytica]ADU31244.1 isoaspartyl dipeptidase [Evansella cellulosilytica DSM 2522]
MITVVKNGEVYAPHYVGQKDVLIIGGRIAAIDEDIHIQGISEHTEIVNATGKIVAPGLIDGHVHITGGGGEGSFRTRTPELQLSDCIKGGITTVVGVLGTDGAARTMSNLVAKAKGLTEEGITCFCLTGNYHVPVTPLTDSIETDIMFIHEIIGSGEIAIADHRSSQPTSQELARLASESRVGGLLSGKGGAVVVHVGDGSGKLELLEEVVTTTDIPRKQFIPTHINRTKSLLEAGIEYAKKGGYVDFTTSTTRSDNDELLSSKCLKKLIEANVPVENISFTSDGQGSLPKFDENRNFIGLGVGRVTSLYDEIRKAVLNEGVPLEIALKVATSNPAGMLQLNEKGNIEKGKDGDILLINKQSLVIEGVMAKGKWLMKEGQENKRGTFE